MGGDHTQKNKHKKKQQNIKIIFKQKAHQH